MLTKSRELEAIPDEEVIGRVRAGEIALYEIIMRRYNQRLFRIARSILHNDHEAEDVLQEAYVRAYLNLDQFAGRAAFATWLTKIAIYEALARARHEKTFDYLSGEEDERALEKLRSSDRDPEQQTLDREARSFLEAAVDKLPDNYRTVFVTRDIEGMNTAETAECLEITQQNVKTRLFRAREIMRGELYSRAGAASSKAFEFLGERCDRLVTSVFAQLSAPT